MRSTLSKTPTKADVLCISVTDSDVEVACIERHARRMHANVYTYTERVCHAPSLVQISGSRK